MLRYVFRPSLNIFDGIALVAAGVAAERGENIWIILGLLLFASMISDFISKRV